MPCTVKKTFETARDTGSFLVAQVKANQQTLHDTIEAICAAEKYIAPVGLRLIASLTILSAATTR